MVNGINVLENPITAQKHIGYLPENNPLYTEMYVREYLQFQANSYKTAKENIENVKIFIIVDLPAPFGPKKPTIEPFFTEKLTLFNAF